MKIKIPKSLVYTSILIYITSTIFGFIFAQNLEDSFDTINNIYEKTPFDYILHNGKILLALILGVITFGLSTIYMVIMNGVFLGLSIYHTYHSQSILFTILSILPHGIFEIPAIILASSLGLSPLYMIFKTLKGDKLKISFKTISINILIIISLLIIAAIVESYITQNLVNNFF
ncbi:stage II sporulation protein M [Bacillus sp. TL12]|uniref:stage II sporulation protein M n=1 Tax=Bacillus sp. TL12 TaxID=2894756 RepID=UPI001F51CFD4|nr:stage II sporulation protein M [Bacillus sp. TL12]MCI0768191.1 stage II sporulation protein M [Bacillus sp. TL12]